MFCQTELLMGKVNIYMFSINFEAKVSLTRHIQYVIYAIRTVMLLSEERR